MVDAAWQSYVRSNTTRGRILDLNDLQPGDIIFSIDHRDRNYGKDVKDIARIDPVKRVISALLFRSISEMEMVKF